MEDPKPTGNAWSQRPLDNPGTLARKVQKYLLTLTFLFFFFKVFLKFILFLFLKSSFETVQAPIRGLIIVSRKRLEGGWIRSERGGANPKTPGLKRCWTKKLSVICTCSEMKI